MVKVSICIPTYNTSKYIGFAVESALNQSFRDIEVIVCDNASTDNTHDLLSKFEDKRLKIFKNETNIGMIRNFNRCIDLASGEFIKFLEADDILEADCVSKMVEFAKNNPNAGIISCGVILIDSSGKVIGGHKKDKTEIVSGGAIISRIRRMGNEIGTTTDVLIRRSVLNNIGFFDIDFENYLNEWDLWIRIAEKSDVGFIAEPLTRVRRHPEQVGAIGAKNNREVDVAFLFIKKLEERWKISKTNIYAICRLYLHFSEEFIWRGIREIAKKPGRQSLSFFLDIISKIEKNIGLKHLIISLLFALFHAPIFITFRAIRKYNR